MPDTMIVITPVIQYRGNSDLVFYIGYEVGRNTLSVPIVLQSSTLTLEVYLITDNLEKVAPCYILSFHVFCFMFT